MDGPRVRIEADIASDGVAITLAVRTGNYVTVFQPVELQGEVRERTEAAYPVASPTLRLPDDVARALLDALAEHYGGAVETRTLRKDYDHERGRVDRLIGHLIERGERG